MKGRPSPAFVQAVIWIAAVAVVATVAAIAFTVNQPSPVEEEGGSPAAPVVRPGPLSVEDVESPVPPDDELDSAPPSEEYVPPPPIIPDERLPHHDALEVTSRPSEPRRPERKAPPPRPSGINETQFVEASALMILASEAFADTPEDKKSLEKVCEAILKDRGIERKTFEAYRDYLVGDDERRDRVHDRIIERVDELQAPTVRVEVGPLPKGPSARP